MPIPNFVLELRKMVGNHPLWMPGVSAVVVNDSNETLLTKRSDFGQWAVVSGILEPGEQPGPGVLREVLEETGVVAQLDRVVLVQTTQPTQYANGDRAQYLDVCFLAHYVSGAAHAADDENEDVRWFPIDELPGNLRESSKIRLAAAFAGDERALFD